MMMMHVVVLHPLVEVQLVEAKVGFGCVYNLLARGGKARINDGAAEFNE